MEKDEIVRRLVRMTGDPYVQRPNDITKNDVANWFGVEVRLVRMHMNGLREINNFWQVAYSQFFEMMDEGVLQIRFDGRKKQLVKVERPAGTPPPKKKLRPFVDFSTMRLGLDT